MSPSVRLSSFVRFLLTYLITFEVLLLLYIYDYCLLNYCLLSLLACDCLLAVKK